MDDSAELQARIARLAGRINRHKTGETSSAPSQSQRYSASLNSNSWVPHRGTPYGVHRGRGRGARPSTHRNRTLVINSTAALQDIENQDATDFTLTQKNVAADKQPSEGWVTKHDRHMQLINNSVYEQKTQERVRAMEETRRQKGIARDQQEKAKIENHLRAVAEDQFHASPVKPNASAHQIVVQGIRFIVADGGSKLIKARDDTNLSLATPKKANVGGVMFFRSRSGNLYRSGLVKATRSAYRTNQDPPGRDTNCKIYSRSGIRKISEPCPQFSTTGSCAKGPQCRYIHDPEKVAICRDFLQAGKCQAGDDCDLSHDPIPERVPACLHFLRGNCTNSECRYAHVKTNSGAPVCRAFATLGYCSKGIECAERHVHECPDYANKGICRNPKCRLPHVDRAGQLRKAAASESVTMDEDSSSDVYSDSGTDSEDVDSDEMNEDVLMQSEADNHELSQQADYVQFT